jgi:hypothetical protein
MANTTKLEGKFIEITGLDADWDAEVELTELAGKGGLPISSIRFEPSGVADKMIIKQKDGTGLVGFYALCETVYDQKVLYYNGKKWQPFLDIGDCVLGTPANARVLIDLE